MASLPAGAEAGAAALLAREARAERARLLPPILIGLGIAACGVAQAFLIARLLATVMGRAEAGWGELGASAAIARCASVSATAMRIVRVIILLS